MNDEPMSPITNKGESHMPTFTNKSSEVFQDGDLVVLPGDSFTTEDEGRMDQMRVQYAWQFSESKAKDAPTEAEAKDAKPAVRELRTGGHVKVDADGKQSEKVGE
jgi:hypothetical protein